MGGGGEYQKFPSNFFCLTVPKIFVLESFSAAKISGAGKVWIRLWGWGIKIFRRFFLSHSAESFRRESFTVSLISGTQKVWRRGGGGVYLDFPSKIFCLTVPKISVGEPFSVSLISGVEEFYTSEGFITIFGFLSNFFCLTVPNFIAGEPFCAVFQKSSGSEKV